MRVRVRSPSVLPNYENIIMKIYLAVITGRISEYMGDDKNFETTRLVYADSYDEAREKVYKHYEDKSSEYCTHYSVYDCKITEPIV